MKFRVTVDMDVSKTVAETIKRTGMKMEPDGTGMRIIIPNTPIIPKRKVKVEYLEPESSKPS